MSALLTRAKRILPLLLLVVALLGLAYYLWTHNNPLDATEAPQVHIQTRDGVVTQIQQLNRLETIAFNVDTVVSSETKGHWYNLWRDEQKGLFIARGRVLAGLDLSQLKPEQVRVSDDGKLIDIQLPPVQIFAVYLDKLEVYDLKTGLFNLQPVDKNLFEQVQATAKIQVRRSACQANILTLANNNAQKHIQSLFTLTGSVVTVTPAPVPACSEAAPPAAS